ncbi:MAG: C4-dicarboxylate TRAP transporter substrate-binding protein [Phreatobacter sp.]|uniref:C4-dicarboxylate TRAP transporter substrate-binding protein n=1 Tax=Phreatobacter sp. TaxID=1966341 RepID=UPI001A631747|nr:C4-dicarboxylate TRAP transporter substrate-binding protein [Phreatobacter sp.]MBL8569560.1 C4-dicarboxylate TRAP transporter substrate-binding protein [Phreatobacter sp.]
MIDRRTMLVSTVATVVAGGTSARAQTQTIKLTASAGHPPGFLWVRVMEEFFIPEVDRRLAAAGKYKIEWTKAWGGTLAKVGQESVAIKDGVSDIGWVGTLFEAARFPLQNVTYYAPFGSTDVALVSKIITDLQNKHPAMADAWNKNNLVYLSGASLDTYQIFTTFPIKTLDDLKGRKISAPGTAANWVKDTGAVAVGGNLNTYFEDIKSGASEGALAFVTGGFPARLHEVTKHVTRINIGAMYAGGIIMNRRRFTGLPPEVQQVLREVGGQYADRFAKLEMETAATFERRMTEAGVTFSDIAPAERKRWADALPDIGRIWAADLESKQRLPARAVLTDYMAALKSAGVDLPRDWGK